MPGCPSRGAAGQRAVIKATFAMSAVQQQPAVSSTCRLGLNIYASHHSLRMHASAADRVFLDCRGALASPSVVPAARGPSPWRWS